MTENCIEKVAFMETNQEDERFNELSVEQLLLSAVNGAGIDNMIFNAHRDKREVITNIPDGYVKGDLPPIDSWNGVKIKKYQKSTSCMPRKATCRKKKAKGIEISSIENLILNYEPTNQPAKGQFRALLIDSIREGL